LTAAGDRPIDAKLHARQPAPKVVIAFVRVHGESGDLNGVFRDRWLVLSGCRIRDRVESNDSKRQYEGKRQPGLGFQVLNLLDRFKDRFWAKRWAVYYDRALFVKV
jgi:hypothetical protein